MKKNLFYKSLLIFFAINLLCGISYCQNDSAMKINDNIAKISSVKLQQKILLTDNQTIQVKDLLISYLEQINKKVGNSNLLLSKIESILTERQKSKYEIIKTEWWNYVQKEIDTSIKK